MPKSFVLDLLYLMAWIVGIGGFIYFIQYFWGNHDV
jgi:hypothetical protein